jgi:hypothetical protein
MSLARWSKAYCSRNSTALTIGALDLEPRLQAHELLQVAEIDSGPHLALRRLDRGPEAEELPQDFQDVVAGGEDAADFHPLDAPQLLDHLLVERVGDRQRHDPVGEIDRHDQVFQGEGARDVGGDDIEVELEGVYLEIGDPCRGGEDLGDGVFSEKFPAPPRDLQVEGGDHLGGGGLLRDLLQASRIGCLLPSRQALRLGLSPRHELPELPVVDELALQENLGQVFHVYALFLVHVLIRSEEATSPEYQPEPK